MCNQSRVQGGEDGEGPAPEMSRGGYGGGVTPQIGCDTAVAPQVLVEVKKGV